jgi:hypothetical protein
MIFRGHAPILTIWRRFCRDIPGTRTDIDNLEKILQIPGSEKEAKRGQNYFPDYSGIIPGTGLFRGHAPIMAV